MVGAALLPTVGHCRRPHFSSRSRWMRSQRTTVRFVSLLLSFLCWSGTVSSQQYVCDDDYDCEPHGICDNTQRCRCHQSYIGEQCETFCPLDCKNGASCIVIDDHGGFDLENDFYCECRPGFRGGLCQTVAADSNAGSAATSATQPRGTLDERTASIIVVVVVLVVVLLVSVAVYSMFYHHRRTPESPTHTTGETEKPSIDEPNLELPEVA